MATTIRSPLGRLPSELILEVFKFAAATSRRSTLALCLVSSWARRLALPYLLSTVTISSHSQDKLFRTGNDLFLRYVSRSLCRPPKHDFNHTSLVRNLWMPHDVGVNLVEIFRRCEHIRNLALSDVALTVLVMMTSTIKGRIFPGLTSSLRVRDLRLTVISTMKYPEDLWLRIVSRFGHRIKALSPVFDMVTHMRLWLALPYERQLQLDHFTRLTHLAIRLTLFTDDLLHSLERLLHSPNLQMIVIELDFEVIHSYSWDSFEAWLFSIRKEDPRVFFASFLPCSFRAEWAEEVSGGNSVWDRAVEETEEWEVHYRNWGKAANGKTNTLELQAVSWNEESSSIFQDSLHCEAFEASI